MGVLLQLNMASVGVMIVLPFVENDSDDTVLTSLFRSFQLVEIVLMENVVGEQFVIEIHIFQFVIRVFRLVIDALLFTLFAQVVYESQIVLLVLQSIKELISFEFSILKPVFQCAATQIC